VLLVGGNHGDEYEGQIALNKLMRSLDPRMIKGRIIFLPAMNYPAAMAGNRMSPIDGLNLNRVFPGDAQGSPTLQIAHYVSEHLLPMTDILIDLHSGGSSMTCLPAMVIYRANEPALTRKIVETASLFGAELGIITDDYGETRTIFAHCRKRGMLKFGCELSGGATVTVPTLRLCEAGLRRVLVKLGILSNEAVEPEILAPSSAQMRLMEITGPDAHVFATGAAIFEPNFELGDTVAKGSVAGWEHYLDDIGRDPVPLLFAKSGMVFGRAHRGRVAAGVAVAVLVTDARESG
jgi:predicted deacylase